MGIWNRWKQCSVLIFDIHEVLTGQELCHLCTCCRIAASSVLLWCLNWILAWTNILVIHNNSVARTTIIIRLLTGLHARTVEAAGSLAGPLLSLHTSVVTTNSLYLQQINIDSFAWAVDG